MKKPHNIHARYRAQQLSELESMAEAISREMPGFETFQKAYDENAVRIPKLRAVGEKLNLKACLELADKLESCSADSPCESMSCFMCQRTRRIRFITKWLPYVKGNSDSLCMVTLVFYQDMFHEKGLLKWDLESLKQRLRKKLERSGFSDPIFGGFEMDYHYYSHDPDKSHWLPHFHLILTNEPEKIKSLSKYMLRERNLHARKGKKNRPRHQLSITNPLHALSYCVTGLWQEYPWFLNPDKELKKGKYARRIHDDRIFCKSLVKLDGMRNSLLTFTANVQKLKKKRS